MNAILDDLRRADSRGVAPPQNWTARAADEIDRLMKVIDRLGSVEAFEMSRAIDESNPCDKELLARIDFARQGING